jgi:hypothetical protein
MTCFILSLPAAVVLVDSMYWTAVNSVHVSSDRSFQFFLIVTVM